MGLEWLPESFPPSGGLAASGFYKLLGRPKLDPLTVLVRETAQNSWDARSGDKSIRYSISGVDVASRHLKALRKQVFRNATGVAGVPLEATLRSERLTALIVSDRGTKGLGGPLHADQEDSRGAYDWVDFVLNVGKENRQRHTGGTYGFGKTICYVVSSVNAVVIHSRTVWKDRPQSRLIACAIGDQFPMDGRLYTGRHWWGASGSQVPKPVTGRAADEVAAAIGLPGFRDGEYGTDIMVVDPELGGRSLGQAMNFMAESSLWHLWPKMVPIEGRKPMDISLLCNGEEVPIPKPEARPPLHGFELAFRALRGELGDGLLPVGSKSTAISCQRPKTVTGQLVTVPIVAKPRASVDDGSNSDDPDSPAPAAVIRGESRHVALLRTPELVVDYLEGPPANVPGFEWAGVFRCEDEHDSVFALAEPPAHDAWQPELLSKSPGKTIVNVTLREIRKAVDAQWPSDEQPAPVGLRSTAVVADDLGSLVRSVAARGPGRSPSVAGGGGAGRNARVRILSSAPARIDGKPATVVTAEVLPKGGSAGTRIGLNVGVALDGTSSDPSLDPQLGLISAKYGDAQLTLEGLSAMIVIPGDTPEVVEIAVARSPSTSVMLDVTVDPMASS